MSILLNPEEQHRMKLRKEYTQSPQKYAEVIVLAAKWLMEHGSSVVSMQRYKRFSAEYNAAEILLATGFLMHQEDCIHQVDHFRLTPKALESIKIGQVPTL